MKPLFREILLAGWPPGDEKPEGTLAVEDNFAGAGPLAGIEVAMKVSTAPYLFVFGGDMPWLSVEIIKRQAEYFLKGKPDVLVPRIGVMTEPLHSIFSCSLHPLLVSYLTRSADRSVRDFYKLTRVSYFILPGTGKVLKAFTNINYPEDLK